MARIGSAADVCHALEREVALELEVELPEVDSVVDANAKAMENGGRLTAGRV